MRNVVAERALICVYASYKIVTLSLSVPRGRFCYNTGSHINENCALVTRALFLF